MQRIDPQSGTAQEDIEAPTVDPRSESTTTRPARAATPVQISPRRRRFFIITILGFFLLLFAGIVRIMLPAYVDRQTSRWPGVIIFDKQNRRMPRPDTRYERITCSLDGETCIDYETRHVELGIVRDQPVGEHPGRPVILLIGDSHMYGHDASSRNVDALLQRQLRQEKGLESATVINGSCHAYSLYEYVVRARMLWDSLQPDMLIVVSFLGNDLVELEDVRRPHLDDELREQPTDFDPPEERTTGRAKLFNENVETNKLGFFSQGMNQAIYFLQEPQRYPVTLAKARRSIELLNELCQQNDAELIVALLPAYSDFVDYRLPVKVDEPLRGVLDMQINRRGRLDLQRICERLDVTVVDLFPPLRAADEPNLYAGDLHLWTAGAVVVADALEPLVVERLRRGKR